jgi:hypothetical protein
LSEFCFLVLKLNFINQVSKAVLKKKIKENMFGNFIFENCFGDEKMKIVVW